MKVIKKLCTLLLCLGAVLYFVPVTALAASGELRFSDPETTVGATVEVTARLSADSNIDTARATLTYDTSFLKFISGEGVTDSGGQLSLTGSGGGSVDELSWTMQFQALREGSTKIEISSVSSTTSSGMTMDVTRGNSTVAIGEGDPSLIAQSSAGSAVANGVQANVNGEMYTILNDFSDALIPTGFVRTQVTFEGQTCNAMIQESSGMYVMDMVSPDGEEDFFLYDPNNGSFTPFQQISIGEDRFLVILSEDMTAELPSTLQQTAMTIEGKEFIAWQNMEDNEFYVIYALNSDGQKEFYQYDTVDGTYQRYIPVQEEQEEEPTGFVDKTLAALADNIMLFVLGAAFVVLFLLLLVIILGTKLCHRNSELDDLYDEYGIDEEEEERPEKKNGGKQKERGAGLKKKRAQEDDMYAFEDEDDEYDDYEEDDYELEDEYELEDDDEYDEDYEYHAADYEDEQDIDDLDELLSEQKRNPKKRQGSAAAEPPKAKPGHMEDDDTFKMDIIDLD